MRETRFQEINPKYFILISSFCIVLYRELELNKIVALSAIVLRLPPDLPVINPHHRHLQLHIHTSSQTMVTNTSQYINSTL